MAVHVRIYMLDEVPAPHSPSGGAAMLHPIGAQLIPTVQENAKAIHINLNYEWRVRGWTAEASPVHVAPGPLSGVTTASRVRGRVQQESLARARRSGKGADRPKGDSGAQAQK